MRLIVWDAAASQQLNFVRADVQVQIESSACIRPDLIIDAVRNQLGLEVAFLRAAAQDVVEVEWLDDGPPPPGMAWYHAEAQQSAPTRRAWERPGWLRGQLPALDDELSRLRMRRTGSPVQVRHTTVTGMLRIPTDSYPVWLKAVPPMFSHEGPVTAWLAALAPHTVPTVLASTPSWWLSSSFPDALDDPADDFLVTHAKLQVAATDRTDELRATGCADRPLSDLFEEVAGLSRRADRLERWDRVRLDRSLPTLEGVFREVDAIGLPSTLVHGDLTPDNVRWTCAGWFLYDWTDVCLGHPFVDLTMPLVDANDALRTKRAQAYAAVWARFAPTANIDRVLQLAPVIGAAFQAANYARIADGLALSATDSPDAKGFLDWLRFWARRLALVLDRSQLMHHHHAPMSE